MCEHEIASTRARYDRAAAELHCELVCDACGEVIALTETVSDYRPAYAEAPAMTPSQQAA